MMKAVVRSVCGRSALACSRRWNALAVKDLASDWATLQARRETLRKVLANVPTDPKVLGHLREKVTGQRPELANTKEPKQLFWKQDFESIEALAQFYEEMMFPVHALRDKVYMLWVEQCEFNSKIVQSKNATADTMANWKEQYSRLGEEMKQLTLQKEAYVAKTFDTEIYNHILNAMRLAGDAPGAHQAAIRVFHDMTDNEVEFTESTKLLAKAICFEDSPQDNSDLLFSFIEYPERGAHTFVQGESLDSVSNRMLDVVAERHSLTFDHGHQLQKDPVFLLRPKEQPVQEEEEPAAVTA
ncbi:hypothetical protein DIPPA_11233 [Diplonema papillatum]|nr:hypothetical protein DIPPA_11233 [Diplonema papillatum]